MENIDVIYPFIFLVLLSILSHWVAYKRQLFNFYKISYQEKPYPWIAGIFTILAILCYLLPFPPISWYIPLALLLVYLGIKDRNYFLSTIKDNQTLPRTSVLWDIAIGGAFFIVSLPLLSLVQNGLEWILSEIFKFEIPKQHFIDFIKNLKNDKPFLIVFFFFVSVLVPIYEEFLYRANLQTWLKNYFSPFGAILVSSFFFAISHYLTIQSFQGKLIVIISTFAASIYLGLAYERQRSLLAPITIHALINGTTFLQVLLF
ncbi:MAG: CPBP family intramembrane metalloprotease [Chlamydiae bacterium]|nr:CPBP family intramembrane metalloprotease [Chlamydiota bacterium]